LIAFDFVSNPSTHGAFLAPVHEGVNRNAKLPINKYSRINHLITDIISDING